MNSHPFLSIAMPVFDCARTVDLAIWSILNQTFEDWELIITDDGSRDNTLEIVRSFNDPRIIAIRCEGNKGLPTRLNECVGIARGKYFARMDGDDIAYPDRLKKQVEYLECHPQVDLLGAGCIVFRGDGEAYGLRFNPRLVSHLAVRGNALSGPHLAHPTWMGRIEWFRRYPYRERFVGTEDRELLIRTRHISEFAVLPEVLLGYREDRAALRKVLGARFHLSRAYVEDAFVRGLLLYGLGGIIFQCLKSGLDVIAICTGLQHKLLRHRASKLPDEVKLEWDAVWKSTLARSTDERTHGS